MKTTCINWMLMATMILSLGMGVTSCSDDDDDKNSEQREQEQQQKASRFWDVVGQLTSSANYTEDYQNKTFEPTIGEPSEQNAYVRIVATNDMATAAERFAALVDADIDENTANYEFSDPDVGTLSYKKTTDGTSLATVEVNIKQLPHLQRIVYCTPEQVGVNGSFVGTAYYRFGDVISREASNAWGKGREYWVCVRPAFGPEGKKTSHWISVSPLPTENIWEKEVGGKRYTLPTGIGTSKEHMQNLAEMLYAILYPHEWQTNVQNHPYKSIFNKGINMFHDFDNRKYDYHNEFFWKRVCQGWDALGIWQNVFGVEKSSMKSQITQRGNGGGLNLLYKGNSWWYKVSWNLTLFQANYQSGEGTEANMHDADYDEVENDVRNNQIDIVSEVSYYNSSYSNKNFFGEDGYRWFIRVATGDELAKMGNSAYDVKTAIAPNTFRAEYVYNAFNYQNAPGGFRDLGLADLEISTDPGAIDVKTISKEQAAVGNVIGNNGQIYADKATCEKATNNPPVAIIVYTGAAGSVEQGTQYRGLAMSMSNMTVNQENENGYRWGANEASQGTGCATEAGNTAQWANLKNGLATTNSMAAGCGKGHNHPAHKACHDCIFLTTDQRQAMGYSDWFIPSIGQWILMAQGIGYTWNGNDGKFNPNNNGTMGTWLSNIGLTDAFLGTHFYWTSTQSSDYSECGMIFNAGYFRFMDKDKDDFNFLRPFIAF